MWSAQLLYCDRGDDRAPAIALAALLALFDARGAWAPPPPPREPAAAAAAGAPGRRPLGKDEVRGRLALLQALSPDLPPAPLDT